MNEHEFRDEMRFLMFENNRLRERIGEWRRLAQEKKPRRETVREGYRYSGNLHYRVFAVRDIPGDLPMHEVLQELRKGFLKTVSPYTFEKCDYSKKYDGWLVEVSKRLEHNLNMYNLDDADEDQRTVYDADKKRSL